YNDVSVIHKSSDDNILLLAVKMSETILMNVSTTPKIPWPNTVLTVFDHPVLYVGDLCHHSQGGY
ncbi:MAG: hypothetical protein ACJBCI_05145, partial [Candidatus Tisiphia sp.]